MTMLLPAAYFLFIALLGMCTGRTLPVGAVRRADNPVGFWLVTGSAFAASAFFSLLALRQAIAG